MGRPPAPSYRLDDRATEKVINNPAVRKHLPSIAQTAKKTGKMVRRCATCSRSPRRGGKTDLNAVREHIASLPQKEKSKLLRLLNIRELVVPFVRARDKQRVKLRIK